MSQKSKKPTKSRPISTFNARLPYLPRIGVIVSFVTLWEIASLLNWINPVSLPAPHDVCRAYIKLFQDGVLVRDVLQSIHRVTVGFGVASVLGISLGLLCGISRRIRWVIVPIVDIARPIPPIAWVPLAILWFGLGDHSSYFIVFLGAFPSVFLNTFAGVESVDRQLIDAARCLGANRWNILTEVIWPGSLPMIFVGIRVGSALAWTSVIAAELVGAQDGLGYMIQLNRIMLQTENLLVGMFTIGIAGALVNILLIQLRSILIPWQPVKPLTMKLT